VAASWLTLFASRFLVSTIPQGFQGQQYALEEMVTTGALMGSGTKE
jgi:hypothetical protein|tara:strand:- start:203 stop:340 length:138 start_codon:yes stop_codon:yes gene_type:complete